MVKSKSFGAVVLKCHIFCNDGVDWSVVWFRREEVRRLGLWAINMGLQTDEGLLVSFVNSEFRDLVRVSDQSSISTDIFS